MTALSWSPSVGPTNDPLWSSFGAMNFYVSTFRGAFVSSLLSPRTNFGEDLCEGILRKPRTWSPFSSTVKDGAWLPLPLFDLLFESDPWLDPVPLDAFTPSALMLKFYGSIFDGLTYSSCSESWLISPPWVRFISFSREFCAGAVNRSCVDRWFDVFWTSFRPDVSTLNYFCLYYSVGSASLELLGLDRPIPFLPILGPSLAFY